ncbi:unnamed protein product [Auanema sp. JU1783]|nr:unnamed protein product [Auanema sp. JU1783]
MQGYTRITNLTIHSTQRCAETGDCLWGTGCDDIRQDTFVTDLAEAGGLFKGCDLPVEGCILFSPTYKPESTEVYEEIKCGQWYQQVNIQMKIDYHNNTHINELALQPYEKYDLHGVTLQVSSISLQVTTHFINQLFLVSQKKSFMIPEQKKPATICGNAQSAAFEFKKCYIRKPCLCLGAAAQLSCSCESASNRKLEAFKIPKNSPNFRVMNKAENKTVTSFMEETTISMENPDYNMERLYINKNLVFRTSKLYRVAINAKTACN